ncbi:MAG: isocitrate/isopropylmalate family dehydrogenase, partial [Aeoliella sp.]
MSSPLRLAIVAGDGIGPEVVAASLKVLEAAAPAAGCQYKSTEFPFSAAHFLDSGHVLDDSDIAELRKFDAILLGAVGGLPNDPRLAGGVIEKGILLKLRFELDQYINL